MHVGLVPLAGATSLGKACQSAPMLIGEAAGRGSKAACVHLGFAYANGVWGCPKDEKMARRYYSMVASAAINDCSVADIEEAATWLREHSAA